MERKSGVGGQCLHKSGTPGALHFLSRDKLFTTNKLWSTKTVRISEPAVRSAFSEDGINLWGRIFIKIQWNSVKGCKIKFPFLHQNIEFHSILYTQGTFGR